MRLWSGGRDWGTRYSKSTSGRDREENVGENIVIKRKARANEQTAEQTSG